ncbi:nicotinate-nucleotide adenylyltransferase [Paenibacillus sp. JCM 10914]|uniref:nicotinate-nucleotide adenylyltransferase n=1 Tax=Paenibacillus sp. JCM 10914 TaxID=1236974 RepID=UPI0003CCB32C|nr:nicotinate-nucleotide adenylyltransferase [Paenibacillus sp. JCM 10914]GAE04142.1 nicotinate-nucleotide adenylyltransferase [Paenibacillus sp. JCM 10914]
MKVGIMGGTFDPIHIGHMLAAETAREAYNLEEVWFMPSHIPPHKEDAGMTGQVRLEMTAAAIADHPSFRTLDIEVKRGGVSYTVDTIRELRQQHPEHDFAFIIGSDMVEYLPRWNRIEELAQWVTFIGLSRPGTELAIHRLPEFLQRVVVTAAMPQIGISSTEIRKRAAKGASIRYMVPDRVYEYIKRSGIYGLQP